jgi:hypothetical protein
VFFAIVHVDPPSSIKLVIVVGGGNNMICSPPLTSLLAPSKGFANLFVVTHTPAEVYKIKQKLLLCKFWPKVYKRNKGCVTHCDLAIYIKKSILRQKKNYRNTQIFHHPEIIIFPKSSKKKPKSFKIL